MFLLTASHGMALDFEIYQGQTTRLIQPELGLGPGCVLRLSETLPPGSFVFFDRYFTTVPLLKALSERNLEGTGTVMGNRVKGLKLTEPSKMKRGDTIEYVSSSKDLCFVEWKDNNKVLLASTCFGSAPQVSVKRWSKTQREFVNVPCPRIVKEYNRGMGEVNIYDKQMECYRTWFKTRKWTWKVILHFIDFSVVNAWLTYVRDAKSNNIPQKNIKDLLRFRLEIAEFLMATDSKSKKRAVFSDSEEENDEGGHKAKHSKFFNPPVKMPCVDKRYDGVDHLPIADDIAAPRKCRLENCKSRSKMKCEKCKTYLCLSKNKNCFKEFHKK